MSEVVDKFPVPSQTKYEWTRWSDGQVHKCTQGTDFESRLHSFAKAAYKWADDHDLIVRVAVKAPHVYVQFRQKETRSSRRGKPPGPPLLREVRRLQ